MGIEKEKKIIEKETESSIERLLSANFFERLSESAYSKYQLQVAFNQYYHYCDYFPKMLSYLIYLLPNDNARIHLVRNLWDEHGCGDLEKSHRHLYKKIILCLGGEMDFKPFPCTINFINSLEELTQNTSVYEALGALGPGTEAVTTRLYRRIVSALQDYSYFDYESLEFFNHHIQHDEYHASEMWDSIGVVCNSNEHYELIKSGARKAIDIEVTFWNSLDDELRGLA